MEGEGKQDTETMGQWTLRESIGSLQLNCCYSVIVTLFCHPQAFCSFVNLTSLRKIRSYSHTCNIVEQRSVISP